MAPLLSIIVPVYKVEDYINGCLSSIYSSNLEDSYFEVIIVNDGSPDNSMSFVYNFASQHHNIVIINKENEGVSKARNDAMSVAKAKYIAFVDADDTIQGLDDVCDCLKSISNKVNLIVFRSFIDKTNKENYNWLSFFEQNITYSGIEVFQKGYRRGSVCGVVYCKSFLDRNGIEFPNYRNGEDTFFFYCCFVYATYFVFKDIQFYFITDRTCSASRDEDKSRIEDYNVALRNINEFINNRLLSESQRMIMNYLQYITISNMTYFAIRLRIKFQIPHSIYLKHKRELSLDKKLKQQILRFSYFLYYTLCRSIYYFTIKPLCFKLL